MNDDSMMLFYQKCYDQLNQKIFEHAITEVSDCDQYFAKLDLLKLQRERIAELLQNPNLEEEKFAEERRHVIFGDDPVYQKAKASWDEELLQKFYDRSLTRYEYVEAAKKFGIVLWFDYYDTLDPKSSSSNLVFIGKGSETNPFSANWGKNLQDDYQIFTFVSGLARVKRPEKSFYVNLAWEQCFEIYDDAGDFVGNYARVKQGKDWFFIDREWKKCFGPYPNVRDFSEGYAVVEDGGKYYFINEQWQKCFGWFDKVDDFLNGIARIQTGNYVCTLTKDWELTLRYELD